MPFSPVLRVASKTVGATQVVAVTGEFDVSSVDSVRNALDQALSKRPQTLVLDLSRLDFCDSSGVHLVVDIERRAGEQGTRFTVVRPTGAAWRVFELSRVDDRLEFVGSDGVA